VSAQRRFERGVVIVTPSDRPHRSRNRSALGPGRRHPSALGKVEELGLAIAAGLGATFVAGGLVAQGVPDGSPAGGRSPSMATRAVPTEYPGEARTEARAAHVRKRRQVREGRLPRSDRRPLPLRGGSGHPSRSENE
jgi:hypothetical protein